MPLNQSPACRKAGAAVSPSQSAALSMRLFSLKRNAFQTIRPVVSRKKRGFSAHFGPGGAVLPPRVLPSSKAKRSVRGAAGGLPMTAGGMAAASLATGPVARGTGAAPATTPGTDALTGGLLNLFLESD